MKLTEKQKAFLGFIFRYLEEWGVSPSLEVRRIRFGAGA
jgi:hypothetical protein